MKFSHLHRILCQTAKQNHHIVKENIVSGVSFCKIRSDDVLRDLLIQSCYNESWPSIFFITRARRVSKIKKKNEHRGCVKKRKIRYERKRERKTRTF